MSKKIKSPAKIKPRKLRRRIPPKPGSPKFIEMQKRWYAKLADSGFDDLEFYDDRLGDFGPHFRRASLGSLAVVMSRNTHTFHFYALLRNFLTHFRWRGSAPIQSFIVRRFAEGIKPGQIYELLKKSPKFKRKKFTQYFINTTIKNFVAEARRWNKTNPEGLDFESNFDDALNVGLGGQKDQN